MNPSHYCGRFAPSPSGPLHFGSLVCALASYLDARSHQGQWLVRIEDIDPPREEVGADRLILDCLRAHHLFWDSEVIYQSQRHDAYDEHIRQLLEQQLIYACHCTRKRLQALNHRYDGNCRTLGLAFKKNQTSLRLNIHKLHTPTITFLDSIQGQQTCNLEDASGDFIVHRKDGFYAYQLAVVADDIFQGVTHIVRGVDLLEPTFSHIALYKTFQHSEPNYSHIPIICDDSGAKLSKQNHAEPITAPTEKHALKNIQKAAKALGIEVTGNNVRDVLNNAISQWSQARQALKNSHARRTIRLKDL